MNGGRPRAGTISGNLITPEYLFETVTSLRTKEAVCDEAVCGVITTVRRLPSANAKMANERKDPNLRRLLNRPVCILCARPAEAEEIAGSLGFKEQISGSEIGKVDKGHTFWLGSLKLQDGSDLDCYVTHSRRQGVQWFTADASILLHILNPRFVVHAGVCAGYRDPRGKIK